MNLVYIRPFDLSVDRIFSCNHNLVVNNTTKIVEQQGFECDKIYKSTRTEHTQDYSFHSWYQLVEYNKNPNSVIAGDFLILLSSKEPTVCRVVSVDDIPEVVTIKLFEKKDNVFKQTEISRDIYLFMDTVIKIIPINKKTFIDSCFETAFNKRFYDRLESIDFNKSF